MGEGFERVERGGGREKRKGWSEEEHLECTETITWFYAYNEEVTSLTFNWLYNDILHLLISKEGLYYSRA